VIDLERWDEIKEIMQAALDLPAEQQAAYLEEACREDEELRRQVEALLAVSATRADIYDNFVVMPPGVHAVDFKEGDEIGPYRIVRPLGTGGMSTVYLADDPRHKRQVALKVLKTPRPRRRLHEEQTVARFHHPNIVTFHDSGQIEAGPAYFVMEYIDGEAITTYCETKRLSIEERLRLFLTACDAVAYAHRHLVVHRDLKPANILVTNDGQAKLLDFGIAKSLSPSFAEMTATAPEDRALTVAFASPEQLAGETTATATDIYSLGVLLCLMLTDRLPYPVKSYHDLPWAVRNMEPERPSQLVRKPLQPKGENKQPSHLSDSTIRKLERTLRGDLDAIVLKTLRKEPDRRYSTVAELAADVSRYLQSEPVSARRGSRWYRAQKFWKRHTLEMIIAAIFIAGLVFSSIIFLSQNREITRQRDRAQREARRTEQTLTFIKGLFAKSNPWEESSQNERAIDLLTRAADDLRSSAGMPESLRAILLSTLGELFSNYGLNDQAVRMLGDATQLQIKHPEDRVELAISYQRLGSAYNILGRYQEADHILGKSLDLLNAYRDTRPVVVASTLFSRGVAKYRLEDHASAETLFREAIAMHKRGPGTESRDLALAYQALGQVLDKKGDSQSASENFRRALAILQRIYGTQSLHANGVLESVALSHYRHGNYSKAESILRSVIEVADKRLGTDYPYSIGVLHNLAGVLAAAGKEDEALSLFQKVLARRERTLGPDSPLTITTLAQIGTILATKGDLLGAERNIREVLRKRRQSLPEGHPLIAASINNLAFVLQERGDLAGADIHYAEALKMYQAVNAGQDRNIAEIIGNRATIALSRGNLQEAEALCMAALQKSREVDSGKHMSTILILNGLAGILIEQARYREAGDILNESLELARGIDPDGWIVGSVLVARGNLYTKSRNGDCEASIREGIGILSLKLNPGNWRVVDANSVLGGCLTSKARYTEAERLLTENLGRLRDVKGEHSRITLNAKRRLRTFYEARDQARRHSQRPLARNSSPSR
jgi:serine/threonine protein kinase/Flp pilus assembly protein TadD